MYRYGNHHGTEAKDGSTGYTAQILLKRKGAIVHREAKTFDRKQAADAWIKRRETELAERERWSGENTVHARH